MEKSMSRILVETVVKKALTNIKENPERETRNLVDMALQFSDGRFQQTFFTTAQTMLQNENSAYYGLVRDAVTYIDADRLFTFGMNLGYNGCTIGARKIRENEKRLGCNIPWVISVQVDTQRFTQTCQKYDRLIREGESLGIYTWMLLAMEQPEKMLSLAGSHSDSAFCIFCEAEDLTASFLDEAAGLHNVMLVIRYDESAADMCATLRNMGLLYSVWYPYDEKDKELIINGDLFYSVQQLSPVFTVLLAMPECPKEVQHIVHQTVQRVRSEQTYRTFLWELQGDNCFIDAIISDDTCSVSFDRNGDLHAWNGKAEGEHQNIFQSSLIDILMRCYPKTVGKSV